MTRSAESLLRNSWRFHFSRDRHGATFSFQRGWIHLLVDHGLRSVVVVLLMAGLLLGVVWTTGAPVFQSALLATLGVLVMWLVPTTMLALLRERPCELRVRDGMLEVPVGLARRRMRLPLSSLVNVHLSSTPFNQLCLQTQRVRHSFMLPGMRRCEAQAMVVVLADYLERYGPLTAKEAHARCAKSGLVFSA
ncbi:MAG: hypothetical protein AAFV53_02025 [Myxococcota bacterium]